MFNKLALRDISNPLVRITNTIVKPLFTNNMQIIIY